ncbi:MAG: hypothetical protein QOH12_3585 [Solirubrobacteraceae bacterium]|jgi:hypothetical protein|nr:hypothetical protein [Solirubrobacteraceae bacterium]
MAGGVDPYVVLGLRPGADQAEIHTAYRAAVRRTHPDAGGSAEAFEAVQEAYEALRETPRRGAARTRPRQPTTSDPRPNPNPAPDGAERAERAAADGAMEAILAESRRLEDEARRLAGLPPRHDSARASTTPEATDSVTAILRDAGDQLREAAGTGARELRRRLRRYL